MAEWLLGRSVMLGSILALLVVARVAFGLLCRLEGYSFTHEIVENDNPAMGLRVGSLLLAVIITFLGVMHPSGISWKEDVQILLTYGLLVILLLLSSRWVNDYGILYGFRNNQEVVNEQNTAVATVEAATYLATALIMSGALAGWEGGFWISVAWFAIGQGLLIVLALLYRLFVPGVFAALDGHNLACGISLGGFLLAGGLALHGAVSGPVVGWTADLNAVALFMAGWLVVMLVAHVVANRLLLPLARLRTKVMQDRNVAAGVAEAVVFVGVTLVYTW